MGELFAELIKRYGIWILVILVLLGALVWFIIHLNAEPGEKISVFWGMIDYKKSKSAVEPELKTVTVPMIEPKPRQELEPMPESKSEIRGSIMSPHSGSRVKRWFRIEGTISGQYRHLWLIERIGELHWPKEPELMPQDGHWVGGVNEGGWPPGGRFEVLLVDVSENANQRFREWLRTGHQTGHYLGLQIENLGDANILDSKEYQLITE